MKVLTRWTKRHLCVAQDWRISHRLARAAVSQQLTSPHKRALCHQPATSRTRGFSRKITEAFSTIPLASSSSAWRYGLTFRADLSTHLTGAISGTETVLGSANKVPQLLTSGCPPFLPSSQMAINPQEACCAFCSTQHQFVFTFVFYCPCTSANSK